MSVNKVILVGRLGRDPETRYTGGGQAVGNFSIATDETYKDRNGEKQKRTEWHKIVVWGKQAEIAQQYLKRARYCSWKAAFNRVNGKIKKVRSAPALKLLPAISVCSVAEVMALQPVRAQERWRGAATPTISRVTVPRPTTPSRAAQSHPQAPISPTKTFRSNSPRASTNQSAALRDGISSMHRRGSTPYNNPERYRLVRPSLKRDLRCPHAQCRKFPHLLSPSRAISSRWRHVAVLDQPHFRGIQRLRQNPFRS